jgi:hypothetical protein
MQSPQVGIFGIDQGAELKFTPLANPNAPGLGDGDCYGEEKPKKQGS